MTEVKRAFRETIRDRIKSIANDPHIKERYDMYADMVLGDLREVLLSEAVVKAAAAATATESDYYEYDGPFIGLMVHARTADEANDIFARAALTAALAAMTAGDTD